MDKEFIVKTKIDVNSLRKGAKDIQKALEETARTATRAGRESQTAIDKNIISVERQTRAIEEQREKIKALETEKQKLLEKGGRVENDEYKEALKFLKQTEDALTKLQDAREKYLETGGKKNSRQIKKWEYEEAELSNQLYYAQGEVESMREDGRAWKYDPKVKEYTDKIIAEEKKLKDMNDKLGVSYDELSQKQEKAFRKSLKEIRGKYSGVLKTTLGGLKDISKRSTFGLKNIIALALGARGLFTIFMKLKTAMVEGINNLAVYSKDFNAKLSETKSLFTQLKNAIGTAIAPALEAMLPTINAITLKFIDMANNVANFFAVLNDEETYIKAIAVNEDYAKSLGKVNNGLASFDKLNVIGQSGKANPMKSFTTVETQTELNAKTQQWVNIAKKAQEAFANVKAYIIDNILPAFEKLDGITANIFEGDWEGVGQKLGEFLTEIPISDIVLNIAKFSFKVVGGIKEALVTAFKEILPVNDENGIGATILAELCTALSFGALTFAVTGNATLAFGAIAISLAGFLFDVDSALNENLTDTGKQIVAVIVAGLAGVFWALGLSKLTGNFSLKNMVIGFSIGIALEGAFEAYKGGTTGDVSKILQGFLKTALAGLAGISLMGFPEIGGAFALVTLTIGLALSVEQWQKDAGLEKGVLVKLGESLQEEFNEVLDTFAYQNQNSKVPALQNWATERLKENKKQVENEFKMWENIGDTVGNYNSTLSDTSKKLEEISQKLQKINGFSNGGGIYFSANALKIPAHATGAVVPPNAPYLAMLGDNKRETEVVSPLSTMKQAVAEVIANQNQTLVVRLDGKTVFESVVKYNNQYKNRTGVSRFV